MTCIIFGWFIISTVDTGVDDAAQPKSKSSKRVANPLSDDELGDCVVDDLQSYKLRC